MDNLENAARAAQKQAEQDKWQAKAKAPQTANMLAQDACGVQESTYNARTHLMFRLDNEIESLIRKIQRIQDLKHRVETLSVHACETALAVGELIHY